MFVAFIPQKKHIIKKVKKVIYLKNKHIITNCISTIVYMIFLQGPVVLVLTNKKHGPKLYLFLRYRQTPITIQQGSPHHTVQAFTLLLRWFIHLIGDFQNTSSKKQTLLF